MRLCEIDGEAAWVLDPQLDVRAHVVPVEIAERPDQAGLAVTAARVFEKRLDRLRPLWQIDVISELDRGASALIWRIYHALADGSTAMRMASAMLWDDEPSRDARGMSSQARWNMRQQVEPAARRRLETLLAATREAPQPWLNSPFDGHIGARRSVAFATVELGGLRRVAAATDGATVNDAVLSIVAGGLQRWLEVHHGHLDAVRVKVPVSLHDASVTPVGGPEPGNRDSLFCLDLRWEGPIRSAGWPRSAGPRASASKATMPSTSMR